MSFAKFVNGWVFSVKKFRRSENILKIKTRHKVPFVKYVTQEPEGAGGGGVFALA